MTALNEPRPNSGDTMGPSWLYRLVILPDGAVDMGLDPYSIIAPRHAEIDRAPGDGRFGSCCDGSTPHLL